MSSNLTITVSEGNEIVDQRRVHNVFTNVGRRWLRDMCRWQTVGISTADVPVTTVRPRWLVVGSGFQLEQRSVQSLVSPLTVTTGPDVYLTAPTAPTFLGPTICEYTFTFSGASSDFDHHGASIDATEFGLVLDVDAGAGPSLSTAIGTHAVAAYRSFQTAITKLAAQTLTVQWELRF